jgi:hypothetical protein
METPAAKYGSVYATPTIADSKAGDRVRSAMTVMVTATLPLVRNSVHRKRRRT